MNTALRRCALVGWVVASLSLAACSAPSGFSLPPPPPTQLPSEEAPIVLKPIVSAPALQLHHWSWSEDKRYIAFWQSDDPHLVRAFDAPLRLRFYDVQLQRVCEFPFETSPYQGSSWTGDSFIADVKIPAKGYLGPMAGVPCVGFTAADWSSGGYDGVLSPSSGVLANTVEVSRTAGIVTLCTTLTDGTNYDDDVLLSFTWHIDERLGDIDMGGQWVSDDSFLIYETLDVGPVLLNTNGDITPLIPKLNGDTTSPRNKVYAQAAINNGFHILLTPRDETAQSFGVQLYHSKSGNTEILPAQFYDGYLSPQGQWLLLRTHEGLWLRSTDESQPLPQKISSISDNAVLFSPDEKLMLLADDTQQTTQLISPRNLQRQRSIRLRSDQQTYTPILYASQWSPDGKAVAMLGLNPNQAISALFVYKIGN